MNFLPSTQQNDMHPLRAKKFEVSPFPIPQSDLPWEEKGDWIGGSYGAGLNFIVPSGGAPFSPQKGFPLSPASRVSRDPGRIRMALAWPAEDGAKRSPKNAPPSALCEFKSIGPSFLSPSLRVAPGSSLSSSGWKCPPDAVSERSRLLFGSPRGRNPEGIP